MINLSLQLKIILFSWLYGIFIYLMYYFFKKGIYNVKLVFIIMNTFSIVMGITLLYFFIIEKIAYGIFHTYSLLVILLSFSICTIIANNIKKWYYDYGDNMAKRRKPMTKAAKSRLLVFGTLSIFLMIYFIFTLISYSVNLIQLTNEKEKLEEKYLALQEEAEELKIEITKLHDPEYLAKFARENYLYSKEGELIIKINETQDVLEDTQQQIDNNRSIVVISFGILALIFLYILLKSIIKKKSNKWFLFFKLLIHLKYFSLFLFQKNILSFYIF